MKRNILKTLTSMAVAALPMIAAAQTAPAYHVTSLTANAPQCAFESLNDSGVAAGTCSNDIATWNNGTITDLGSLPFGTYAQANAISSTGIVVGEGDTGNGRPQAIVSTPGGLLNIDPVNGGNARAIGVMDNGVIFGDMTKSLSGGTASWNVMMWTADPSHPGRYRETILPHYPGGDTKYNGVYAQESNKIGQVAGWVTTTVIGQLGAIWNNDAAHTVTPLQALPFGNGAIANGLNDLGQVVGQSNNFATATSAEAVLWQNDATHSIIDLGTLPGDTVSSAQAINNAGQIVGWSQTSMNAGPARAFLYQNGAMYDLATLVDPADGFWTIQHVFAINNAGQILAIGSSGGIQSSIILTPVAQ